MPSSTPETARHLALLAEDLRIGIGAEGERDLVVAAPATAEHRAEAAAARASGFVDLSLAADGRPAHHVGTPLSFLAACWALARTAMPTLPEVYDPAVLVTERASLTGRRPTPPFSAGGACRALRAADGWWALSLARPEDIELVPALTGAPVDDPWRQLEEASVRHPVAVLVSLARDLGLPASTVGAEVPAGNARPFHWDWSAPQTAGLIRDRSGPTVQSAERTASAEPLSRPPVPLHEGEPLRVLDLTSLWAGPLCGSLLAQAGCDVVKVEAPGRPDGARRGDPRFFDLMNGGKRCVALDFDDDRGVLAALIARADVVLEGSRPEALAARGIRSADVSARGGVWVRFAAYPTAAGEEHPSRVGFGDDVALGAGLRVDDHPDSVLPCGDALADPLTGVAALSALAATLRAKAVGARTGGCRLEVRMAHVAARAAQVRPSDALDSYPDSMQTGPSSSETGQDSSVLSARAIGAPARALGADTDEVIREWCPAAASRV